MATTNAIDNKSSELTIDPGASGDSFVQFDINTTGEFRMGVDDTDDSFRISQGSALGTSDTFVMTADGERTMPLQPAFYANLGTDDANVTGDGTTYTVGSGNALTEVYDQSSDFNTNGTFTASVTGRYYLMVSIQIQSITTTAFDSLFFQIVTSNRTHTSLVCDPSTFRRSSNLIATFSSFCDMDASDVATTTGTVSGSTLTVGINSGATRTYFSGYLVC